MRDWICNIVDFTQVASLRTSFVIFALMMKYSSVILLFLLLFAFVNAGILSVQGAAVSSSMNSGSNDCFNTNVSRPGDEIERCNLTGYFGSRVQQLFKKALFFFTQPYKQHVSNYLTLFLSYFSGLDSPGK